MHCECDRRCTRFLIQRLMLRCAAGDNLTIVAEGSSSNVVQSVVMTQEAFVVGRSDGVAHNGRPARAAARCAINFYS